MYEKLSQWKAELNKVVKKCWLKRKLYSRLFMSALEMWNVINIDKLTMTPLFVATVYFVRNVNRIDFMCARTTPSHQVGWGRRHRGEATIWIEQFYEALQSLRLTLQCVSYRECLDKLFNLRKKKYQSSEANFRNPG